MSVAFDILQDNSSKETVFPPKFILDFQILIMVYENRKITSDIIRAAASKGKLLGFVCVGKKIKLQEDFSDIIMMGITVGKSASDIFDIRPEWVDTICDLVDRDLIRVVRAMYISDSSNDVARYISSSALNRVDFQVSTIKRSIKSCTKINQVVNRYAN